jgi:hypothetical protein
MMKEDQYTARAGGEIDLAEAELALLKQEMLIRQLLDTGEPTAEAKRFLDDLRRRIDHLTRERQKQMRAAAEVDPAKRDADAA